MRATEFITELRRNPEHNTQRDRGYATVRQMLQGRDLSNVGISMTMLPKLGINPQSNYNTPIGIYFYPADYYLELRGDVPFQKRAPYANVFEYRGRVLNVIDYTVKQFDRDIEILKKLYPQQADRIHQLALHAEQTEEGDEDDLALHYESLEAITDDPLVDRPAGWLWFVLWNLVDSKESGPNAIKWNHMLRQLGYDVVVDQGLGVIHENETYQGVVLNPKVISPIKRIENKAGAKAYDTLGQQLIEPDTWHVAGWIANQARRDPSYFRPDSSTDLPNSVRKTASKLHRLFVRFIEIMQQHPEYWNNFEDPQKTATEVMRVAPAKLQPAIQAVYTQWLHQQHQKQQQTAE
jgi:hypothetical protein